jgi:hypothetical protein
MACRSWAAPAGATTNSGALTWMWRALATSGAARRRRVEAKADIRRLDADGV